MVMLAHPDFKGILFALDITVVQEKTNPVFTAEIR